MLVLSILMALLSLEANSQLINDELSSDIVHVQPSRHPPMLIQNPQPQPITPVIPRHLVPELNLEQKVQPITAMQSFKKVLADPYLYANFRRKQEDLLIDYSSKTLAVKRLPRALQYKELAKVKFLSKVAEGSLLFDRYLQAININSARLLRTAPQGSAREMQIFDFSKEQEWFAEMTYDETKRKAAATLHAIIGSDDRTGNLT